ncbi:MAG TPA: hypothetical protein VK970_26095 [Candidatus Methylacidiphilales bacterium]|nr:hypothetical protein [Candidatus Methylacidiphilales bacterium]
MAACVVLLVMATGVAGLFGLYLSQKRFVATMDAMSRAEAVMDDARHAQVTFKIQVQEWKNILIRGYQPDAMPDLRAKFESREKAVRDDFVKVQEKLPSLELPSGHERALKDTADVLTMHTELGKAYRDALGLWKADDPLSFRAVDAKVRGMDRPIDAAIDRLTAYLASEVVLMHGNFVKQGQETYSFLYNVACAISGLALLVTLAFVYFALRRNDNGNEILNVAAKRLT